MARKRVNNRTKSRVSTTKDRSGKGLGLRFEKKSLAPKSSQRSGKQSKTFITKKNASNKSLRNNTRRNSDNKSYGEDREISNSKYLREGKSQDFRSKPNTKYSYKSSKDYDEKAKRYTEEDKNLLIGRNPINEALRAGQAIDKVWVLRKDERGRDKRLSALVYELKQNDAVILELDRKSLDRLANNQSHQGIVAQCPAKEYMPYDDLLSKEKENSSSFLILLDRIQDPHNLGAVLRVADTSKASGVIIPKHESVGLTNTVAKSSAGAISYVPVTRVQNLASFCERLKEEGYWLIAADMDGENLYTSQTLNKLCKEKIVLMIGNEGKGIAEKLKSRADLILSIPMKGNISSLNASVSTAIIAYEILRRRDFAE